MTLQAFVSKVISLVFNTWGQRGRAIDPRSQGQAGVDEPEPVAEAGTAGPGLTSPGGPAGRRFLLDALLRRIRRKD